MALQPPLTADYGEWDGAFITSTSRLVLPINVISLPLATYVGTGTGWGMSHSLFHSLLSLFRSFSSLFLAFFHRSLFISLSVRAMDVEGSQSAHR